MDSNTSLRSPLLAVALVATVASVLVSATPAQAEHESCNPTVFSLQDPDEQYVPRDVTADLEAVGQVAGGGPPVIWNSAGEPRDIEIPFGDVAVTAVNASGDMAGSGYQTDHDNFRRSWIYTDAGEVTVLRPSRRGESTYARDINDERVVVGQQDGFPIIWKDPTERAERLEVPDNAVGGAALGVGLSGRAKGYLVTPKHQFYSQWSPEGQLRTTEVVPQGFFTGSYLYHGFSGQYAIGQLAEPKPLPAIFGPDGVQEINFPDDAIRGQEYSISRSGIAAGTVQFADQHQEGFLATPSGDVILLPDTVGILPVIDANSVTIISVGAPPDLWEVETCASNYLQ